MSFNVTWFYNFKYFEIINISFRIISIKEHDSDRRVFLGSLEPMVLPPPVASPPHTESIGGAGLLQHVVDVVNQGWLRVLGKGKDCNIIHFQSLFVE